MLEMTADEPPHAVFSIALLVACLAVARSPSSAIALVSELGAHGPFTTTILSVIILIDVVVVVLFALSLLVVSAISPQPGTVPQTPWVVLGMFSLQLLLSAAIGIVLGYLLHGFILLTSSATATAVKGAEDSAQQPQEHEPQEHRRRPERPPPPQQQAAGKTAADAATKSRRSQLRRFNSVIGASKLGGSASTTAEAALSAAADAASGALFATPKASYRRHAALIAALWLGVKVALLLTESLVMQLAGFEIFQTEELEEEAFGVSLHQPLIISMVAGFVVVNFTSSRRSFLRILHDSSEPVYIAFFTLTGMTLQIETLLPNLPTALLIFTLRLLGICVGAFWGGKLGGAPKMHYERFWMTFVTQAGVTLGLAQRIGVQFADSFGSRLALCVTAEVVFNQLVGPLLFKAAILGVGEAHTQYEPHNGPGQLGISAPRARSRVPEFSLRRAEIRKRWRCVLGWSPAAGSLPSANLRMVNATTRWALTVANLHRPRSLPATRPDPAFYTPDGAGAHTTVSLDELLAAGPRLGASASARRAARLKQLVSEMGDAAIVHRLAPLVSTADAAAAAAGVSTGGDPAVLRAAGTKVSGNGQGGGGKGTAHSDRLLSHCLPRTLTTRRGR